MVSWKKVFKQFPPSNPILAKSIKNGTKGTILELEMLPVNKEGELSPCVRIKGCPHWIRLNKVACQAFDEKYGEDCEEWVGKRIQVNFKWETINKKETLTLIVTPIK